MALKPFAYREGPGHLVTMQTQQIESLVHTAALKPEISFIFQIHFGTLTVQTASYK